MLDRFIEGIESSLQKLVSITSDNSFPALVIQYCGSALYAKVAVAAGGDVTLTADDTDGATTTVATFDVSDTAYDTMGELVDGINATGVFRAYLVGMLRTTSSNDTLKTISATSCATTNGLTLYTDNDVSAYKVGFAITNHKFASRPTGGFETQKVGWVTDELCENALNYMSANATFASGTCVVEVYSCDDVAGTENLIYTSSGLTTATAAEIGASPSPDTPWVKGNLGHRLLVRYSPSAAAVTATATYAIGTTQHKVGNIVEGANYTGCR